MQKEVAEIVIEEEKELINRSNKAELKKVKEKLVKNFYYFQ